MSSDSLSFFIRSAMGALLLMVQAGILGYFSHSFWMPSLAMMLLLGGLMVSRERRVSLERWRGTAAGAMAVVTFFFWMMLPQESTGTLSVIANVDYSIMRMAAGYLLLVQTGLFLFPGSGDGLPAWTPAHIVLAALTLGGALSIPVTVMREHLMALGMAILFTLLAALAFAQHSGREWRPLNTRRSVLLYVSILLVVLIGGSGGALVIYRGAGRLDEWLGITAQNLRLGQRSGFSNEGGLNSVKRSRLGGMSIALRVKAAEAPGYLAGAAFDVFDGKDWRLARQEAITMAPSPVPSSVPTVPDSYRYFPISSGETPEVWTFWSSVEAPGAIFLPNRCVWVAVASGNLTCDSLGIVKGTGAMAGAPYFAGVSTANMRCIPPDGEADGLSLPASLDPRIRTLAADICRDKVNFDEKTAAVMSFFHTNYQYSQDTEPPAGRDRLAWFLLEPTAAHCEYFATGAAVLLRLAGIPTRYVTGFVVENRNPITGYWTAYGTDAHAWVEAWDGERKIWTVVEATPSAGVPGRESVRWMARFADACTLLYAQIQQWIRAPRDWLRWDKIMVLGGAVILKYGGWVFLGVGLLMGGRWYRRRKPKGMGVSVEVRQLHRLLRRKDKEMRRHGLVRRPGETLHRFADRIERKSPGDTWAQHGAVWYRDYAVVRYDLSGAADARKRLMDSYDSVGK